MLTSSCARCGGDKKEVSTPTEAIAGVVSTLIGIGAAAIAILILGSWIFAKRLDNCTDENILRSVTSVSDALDMEEEEEIEGCDLADYDEGNDGDIGKSDSSGNTDKNLCSGLGEKFKILSAYAQVTNLFYTSLTIPWPAEISAIFGVLGAVNIDIFGTLSIGCVATSFYDTFTFVMVMPIVVLGIAASSYCLGMCCIKKQTAVTIWRGKILRMLALVLFLIYPTISKTCFQMWAGYAGETPIDGSVFLAIDLRINKADAEYQTYSALAVVAFVVYVLGIPGTVSESLCLSSVPEIALSHNSPFPYTFCSTSFFFYCTKTYPLLRRRSLRQCVKVMMWYMLKSGRLRARWMHQLL
jgi:hypothetical protein